MRGADLEREETLGGRVFIYAEAAEFESILSAQRRRNEIPRQRRWRVLHGLYTRLCEVAAAMVSANGFQVPIAPERRRLAELDALRVEFSHGIAHLAAEAVARGLRLDVQDAIEGAGAVERGSGAPHELELV